MEEGRVGQVIQAMHLGLVAHGQKGVHQQGGHSALLLGGFDGSADLCPDCPAVIRQVILTMDLGLVLSLAPRRGSPSLAA